MFYKDKALFGYGLVYPENLDYERPEFEEDEVDGTREKWLTFYNSQRMDPQELASIFEKAAMNSTGKPHQKERNPEKLKEDILKILDPANYEEISGAQETLQNENIYYLHNFARPETREFFLKVIDDPCYVEKFVKDHIEEKLRLDRETAKWLIENPPPGIISNPALK